MLSTRGGGGRLAGGTYMWVWQRACCSRWVHRCGNGRVCRCRVGVSAGVGMDECGCGVGVGMDEFACVGWVCL
jgi:hypothetical protein